MGSDFTSIVPDENDSKDVKFYIEKSSDLNLRKEKLGSDFASIIPEIFSLQSPSSKSANNKVNLKQDPIFKSLNLRLEDGYHNIMRKVPDPNAIENEIFILRQTIGEYKPVFKKRTTSICIKEKKTTPLCVYNY